MDFLILVIVLIILAETTSSFVKTHRNRRVSTNKRRIYIDTSALIDGRILPVAQTGFIGDDLVIPRSVIRELQLLADGKDPVKRTRSRFGMDTANELERVIQCNVTLLEDELDHTPVDERLISLAKKDPRGVICTTDINLIKVAKTEGIATLNINDLALVLNNEHFQGERLTVRITEKGNSRGQGVGHLENGVMVVVDNAATKVGQEVNVEIQRSLQTSTGRMIFAKLTSPQSPRSRSRQ